eukprot:1562584-Amphidinium_carterae.1
MPIRTISQLQVQNPSHVVRTTEFNLVYISGLHLYMFDSRNIPSYIYFCCKLYYLAELPTTEIVSSVLVRYMVRPYLLPFVATAQLYSRGHTTAIARSGVILELHPISKYYR